MKKLMCLKTGKLHEVADSTDWGDGYKEVKALTIRGAQWIWNDASIELSDDIYIQALTHDYEITKSLPFGAIKKTSSWVFPGDPLKGYRAFRVISTGDREQHTDLADNDNRPLSPQEAEYSEKMAALQPEPEQVKTFPPNALQDMTDKTFAHLLGIGQFVGGRE